MRTVTPLAVLLLALTSSCAHHPAPAPMAALNDHVLCTGFRVDDPAPLPAHQAAARRLLAEITPEQTSYRHRPTTLRFKADDTPAECRGDCSSVLTALLQSTYHITDEGIVKWLHVKRPYARTYHDAIVDANCVTPITQAPDARPGDILAICFPEEAKDTGHTMLVDAAPLRRNPSPPLVEGTIQYEVAVIDCTASPHGPGDTRLDGSHKAHPGLGRGIIRIYTNESGAVEGYTWSTAPRSVFRPQTERHLVIGRLPVP